MKRVVAGSSIYPCADPLMEQWNDKKSSTCWKWTDPFSMDWISSQCCSASLRGISPKNRREDVFFEKRHDQEFKWRFRFQLAYVKAPGHGLEFWLACYINRHLIVGTNACKQEGIHTLAVLRICDMSYACLGYSFHPAGPGSIPGTPKNF